MDATSPYAQMTIRPGFVCAAEDLDPSVVNTGALDQRGGFACSDPRHDRLRPLLWRTLEACAHETFIDCPYYEQLQYVAAHPLYQLSVNVLGIRPGSPGFASVDLRPDLGGLTWARGSVPHRLGPISVEVECGADGVACTVSLPEGLSGRIAIGAGWRALPAGRSQFRPHPV